MYLSRITLGVCLTWCLVTPVMAQVDPSTSRGFEADKVYDFGSVDHVGVFSGSLVLTLPVGPSYPLGGDFSYRLSLVYNSNLWDFENFCGPGEPGDRCQTIATPAEGFTAGAGWNLSLGRLLPPGTNRNRTTLWQYIDSSGAIHGFYNTLHAGDPQTSGVSYSRDGSYLRMKVQGAARWVEDTDGRRFRFQAPTAGADEWLLTAIDDPFGNQLTISYLPSLSNWTRWSIEDRYGRTHTVTFEDGGTAAFPKRIAKVELAAFDNTTATYDFDYTVESLARSCPHKDDDVTGPVNVPLLASLSQPDGTTYTPTYAIPAQTSGCSLISGRVRTLTLPTLGSMEWTYGSYTYPFREADDFLPLPNRTRPPVTTGVATRTYKDRSGNALASWSYEPQLEQQVPGSQPNEFKVIVTDPQGNTTHNYFSVDRDGNIYDPDGWNAFDYGLPFSRNRTVTTTDPVDGSKSVDLYLSTETFDASGTLHRSTWVRYEMDAPGGTPSEMEWAQNLNRRQIAERTQYENDGTLTEWFRRDFDGLGHHRFEHRRGSFQADAGRTMFVNFNPGQGTYALDASNNPLPGFTMWPTTSPWILGTSTYQYEREDFLAAEGSQVTDGLFFGELVTAGAVTAWVETDYDGSTGFLECRRRLRVGTSGTDPPRDPNDVLEVFTPDGDGNIATEAYFGGDVNPLGSAGCANPPARAEYLKSHTWQYGELKRSVYLEDCTGGGELLVLADNDIDQNTGLVSRSRDSAGYGTTLTYDGMGRLLSMTPDEEASTEYAYAPAGAAQARVVIEQKDGNHLVNSEQVVFDDLGRVCKELELRSSGNWARRMRSYNGNGWIAAQTEWVSAGGAETGCASSLASIARTQYQNYDPYGRAGRVVSPDGSTVDFAYLGVRQVKRTAKVATGDTETEIQTLHRYDPHGRLRKVIDHANTASALTTNYSYEVGGQINQVVAGTQERIFSWDRRGFLQWEQHPELVDNVADMTTGRLEYPRYDSMGNIRRRDDGEHEIEFIYDRAERVTQVKDLTNNRLVKEYFYHRNNLPGQFSAGKLYQAKRHNHGAPVGPLRAGLPDIVVTETYAYAGRGGRVSERTTSISRFDARVFTQSFTWDVQGDPQTITYPSCLHAACTAASAPTRTVSNIFDARQLVGVSGYASNITYHTSGMVHQVVHTNGVTDTQTVTNMPRPTQISSSGAASWSSGVYAYDGSGNAKAIGGDTYRYDAHNRLTTATLSGAPNQSFVYDRHGNITRVTTGGTAKTITVDARTNRLTAATYDRAGNMQSSGSGALLQEYRYDALNKMSTFQSDSEARGYLYTADDERLVEFDFTGDPWVETWTIRDLKGRVLRQWQNLAEDWSWKKDYIYRDSLLLATEEPAARRHLHLDHLGTPRLITDGTTGAQVAAHRYHPFGEEITDPSQTAERMKFTAHERESGAGDSALDYMHARYYHPGLGRFLSMDPDKESANPVSPQSWNRYSYAYNSPLKYTDPDGENPLVASALLGGVSESGLTIASNLINGRPALEGAGKSFIEGAAFGAGGFGVFKLAGRGFQAAQKYHRARRMAGVRAVGAQGEDAVRQVYEIGKKMKIDVPGTDKYVIPDGVTKKAIHEVKNVKSLSFIEQLRFMSAIAKKEGKEFILFVRRDTKLAKTLEDAINRDEITLMYIP